jgi:signal transduction histidine kinase
LELEEKETTKNLERIVDSINDEINDLNFKNKDYASWDETYAFVQDKNERYIKSELGDETFANLKINLVFILDNSFRPLYVKGFNLTENEEKPLISEEKKLLTEMNINHLITKMNLSSENGQQGIITIDGTPMIISLRRILKSDETGKPKGYMLMGKYLDKQEIEYISKITHLDFDVYDISSINNNVPQDLRVNYNSIIKSEDMLIKRLSRHIILGYKIWKGSDGKPLFIIRTPMEREIFLHGLNSVTYIMFTIIGIGIVFIYVMLVGLERAVLRRLVKLDKQVKRISSNGDFSLRVEEKGHDELSTLANSVNFMIATTESSLSALKENNKKLKELDKLKDDFISMVTHELRTPLTSILGFASIIKRKLNKTIIPVISEENEKFRKACEQSISNLDIIISEGERLTNIVNDVLDLSKIESGKLEWKQEKVYLSKVVEKAINAVQGLLTSKKLSIIKELSPNIPPVVGDEDKLLQVIINLLSNAVKFTEKGSITCRSIYSDNEVLVSVTDTGIGIDEESQKLVFDKFKQIGDKLINKPKGTGLGLTITKNIIEQHGGKVWVESKVNVGSTFTFTLPIIK